MPSSSDKQARFMAMVAHDPAAAKRVGVPQSVGEDFAKADSQSGRLSHAMRRQKAQADALRKRRGKAMAVENGEVEP